MSEKIGLEAVFETRSFDAGLRAYTNGLQLAARVTATATSSLNFLGQIAIGAMRRLGELAVDGLMRAGQAALRFSQDLVRAAFDGSAFDDTLGELYASLVNVTRTSFTPLVNQLNGLVTQTAPAFLGVVQVAQEYLGSLASDALAYGQNIVSQLAQGMWDAFSYVVQVLSELGSLIAYWLAPGSPPRILPDLDQWGTDAMNEFLSGWTKADFGIFKDISSTLEALIRSTGDSDDAGLIPRIIGSREGIAQAVEELRAAGTISAQTMDAIIAQVGSADASVRDYLESFIGLEAANQAVAEAQADLNRITAEYDELLKPVDDKLSEIDEAQTQLAEDQRKSMLALILADPNASASAKRQAALEMERIDAERARRALLAQKAEEVDAATERLDAATEAQQLAQDQLDSAQAQIDMITQQNRLYEQQADLLERLANAGTGPAPKAPSGGVVKPSGIFKPDTSAIEGWLADIRAKLEGAWNQLEAAWGPVWARIAEIFQPTLDAIDVDLIPAVSRLLQAFQDDMPQIRDEIARTTAFGITQWGVVMPTVISNLGSSIDSLAHIWEISGGVIIELIGRVARGLITSFVVGVTIVSGIIAGFLKLVEILFVAWEARLTGDWSTFWEDLRVLATDFYNIFQSTTDTVMTAIFNLFDIKWADIGDVVAIVLQQMSDDITEKLQAASDGINETLNGWADAFDTKMEEIRSAIFDATTGASGLINDLLESAKGLWAWLTEHIFNFQINLPELPDWAIPGSPTPFEMGLRGIAKELQHVSNVASHVFNQRAPMMQAAMSSPALTGGGGATQITDARQFFYQPNYTTPARGAQGDAAVMQAMWSGF